MEKNIGIGLVSLIITIVVILILTFVTLLIITGIKEIKTNTNINKITIQNGCEHEFVITSRYNIFLQSYKTFSKCVKCGLEV